MSPTIAVKQQLSLNQQVSALDPKTLKNLKGNKDEPMESTLHVPPLVTDEIYIVKSGEFVAVQKIFIQNKG